MRFITARLNKSMQLFYSLSAPWLDDRIMNMITADDTLEHYCHKIFKRFFDDKIMFSNELKRLLLNDDGTFKSLNRDVGNELIELDKRINSYADDMWEKVSNAARAIENAYPAQDIGELARFRLHDAHIYSAQLNNNKLRIIVELYGQKILYQFATVKNSINRNLLKPLADSIILYEELFVNDDKTYEYNILGGYFGSDTSQKPHDERFELSIPFYDVMIEEIYD